MYAFLTKLKEKGLNNSKSDKNGFGYILRLLTMTSQQKNTIENEKMFDQMRKGISNRFFCFCFCCCFLFCCFISQYEHIFLRPGTSKFFNWILILLLVFCVRYINA